MGKTPHLTKNDLKDKLIDVHSHIGVWLKAYINNEFPYAETMEGIYYKQLLACIDVNVVFPFSGDLFFDFHKLITGELIPADTPISDFPYKIENELLLTEIYDRNEEIAYRFVPFISVDPGRFIAEQVSFIENLIGKYPIYGIKINPVGIQTKASALINEGKAFIDFARNYNIPFIFHTVGASVDEYSQPADILNIAEKHPDVRFCLAHCIHFNKTYLNIANSMPNVWVDTAAFKIQIDLLMDFVKQDIVKANQILDIDYSDHRKALKQLVEIYPDLIIWGTDSPAYRFYSRRKQGDSLWIDFAYKGSYEDEVNALKSLTIEVQKKIANENTLKFLFGT